jgi:glyoxylase I family protein
MTGARHMGFSVRNLDRSIRFYCDVLGTALVREPYDGDSPSFCGRMAVVGLGKLGLDLFEHAGNGGELFELAHTGLDHVAFPTESVEEFGAWASWLDTCNVSHSGVREVAGVGAMLNFVDPDGIQLEFLFIDRARLST